MTRVHAAGIGLLIVVVLAFLTTTHLGSQGAYYDELFQAPAAFLFIGSHPIFFTQAYQGVPILNMSYVGAIKSDVYGLYLKFIDPHFSLITWRLLGITFVSIGLFGFYWLAGTSLGLEGALLFAALLLTDISVIITTRHDWGPTALALALRLILIGIWLSLEFDELVDRKFVIAGFIVGISIFEKLSSIVLLGPFAILIFKPRKWIAATAGLVLGAVPLLVVNAATFRAGAGFISLSNAENDRWPFSLHGLLGYAYRFLSLGHGEMARAHVLGEFSNAVFVAAEATLLISAIVIVFASAIRPARLMAAAYLAISVGLLLLPRETFIHHWLIGTPFQYTAIVLALAALDRRTVMYKFLLATVVCLILIRIPTLASVEIAFVSGKASTAFDPAFNRLMKIAASRWKDAVFIASDWGSATQIYCSMNGADEAVFEPIWGTYSAKDVLNIASTTKKRNLYVVTTGLAPQFADTSASIVDAMTNAPDWQSVPLDEEVASLHPIRILKFVRRVNSS